MYVRTLHRCPIHCASAYCPPCSPRTTRIVLGLPFLLATFLCVSYLHECTVEVSSMLKGTYHMIRGVIGS